MAAAPLPDPTAEDPSSDFLQAIQQQASTTHTRRIRPPTLESFAADENRVPLRQEKLQRRESRMGLRTLFGRSSRMGKDAESDSNSTVEPRPTRGVRSSILYPSRSEAQLSTVARSEASPATGSNKSLPPLPTVAMPRRTVTGGREKPLNTTPPRATRRALAAWDPPPLFQAYPQAIRHAHLPATVMSADSIIKHNNRKGDQNVLGDLNRSSTNLDADDAQGPDATSQDKSRRRHTRNTSASTLKLEWTTKIYVLVTSGYLLQYSGEGQFDRLPEKVLQLSKSSAAFASDSIPGRHWVLQVCSAMDSDGTPAPESRSLLSRISFRSEKRNSSNFLMVFEDADDMESWIILLRREIEALGGKKNLSETGKPKIVEALVSGSLRPQTSQRTLVVRDPERFSRVFAPEQIPWQQNETADPDGQRPETPPEQPYDDVSTTTSIVSHDGRQLDSLRDSGNRLSYISSGQRTVITSAGSSPAGSPVRESFSSEKDDPRPCASHELPVAEPRLRPNASLISERRQSMQSINPIVDLRPVQPPPRPQSTAPDIGGYQNSPMEAQMTPNFSVPHIVGRRYSSIRSPTADGAQLPPPPLHAREPLLKGVRKAPPTALPMTRPLSTVADQPSPSDSPGHRDLASQNIGNDHATQDTDSASTFSSWAHEATQEHPQEPPANLQRKYPPRRSSFMPIQDTVPITVDPHPRRFSSLQALRSSTASAKAAPESTTFYPPKPSSHPRGPPPVSMPEVQDEPARSRSSMDSYRSRSRSPAPSSTRKSNRASIMSVGSMHSNHSQNSDRTSRLSLQRSIEVTVTEFDCNDQLPRPRHASVMSSISKSQQGLVPTVAKNLCNRKSMPHLAEGPPPAPPPNCALPPIPPKQAQAGGSHWKTIRI